MNFNIKHYRCKHCQKIVTVAAVNKNQKPQSTNCPSCNASIDEHDEVVRMVATRQRLRIM